MAQYRKAVDVWKLPDHELQKLQTGQWVYAGSPDNKGIWCGMRSTGTKVVAWKGNIDGRKKRQEYIRSLIKYSKG